MRRSRGERQLGVRTAGRGLPGARARGPAPRPSGASRARKQAALIAALGGGTALTALVGLAGHTSGWRAVFALAATVSVALIPLLGPNQPPGPQRARPSALRTLGRPEVRFISLVAVPEGAAVFGFVVFFAPALQRLESALSVAALGTGGVGLGMLVVLAGALLPGHFLALFIAGAASAAAAGTIAVRRTSRAVHGPFSPSERNTTRTAAV